MPSVKTLLTQVVFYSLLRGGIEFNCRSLHLDLLPVIIFEETDADQSGEAKLTDLERQHVF